MDLAASGIKVASTVVPAIHSLFHSGETGADRNVSFDTEALYRVFSKVFGRPFDVQVFYELRAAAVKA